MYTKGEWTTDGYTVMADDDMYLICTMYNMPDIKEEEANAKRIVTCVNSHDDLLEACEMAVTCIEEDWIDMTNVRVQLQQAINRAKGV